MSNIAKTVGERLRNYRLQANLSQETLAELANLHPTYIGQLERGEKNATLETLEKVCYGLQLPIENLVEHITPYDIDSSYPERCYELILSQPVEEQKFLYELIQKIIEYKLKYN